ncbi:MAG TPA: DUF3576 domain-containing protein [Stellaceae bacterium]|nr:DUF3576 domain-containing protein [Stellaceae bacterium]
MSALYYRLPFVAAASLSLALAACGSNSAKAPAPAGVQRVAANEPHELDTDATIWTVLGIAHEHPHAEPGPKTGPGVNPILWQASHDTLDFVKFSAEDPKTGVMVSHWYSPAGRPNERFKITVFIVSRVLRTDSLNVRVRRQVRGPTGDWADARADLTIDSALDTAILRRARELRHAWFPNEAGNK